MACNSMMCTNSGLLYTYNGLQGMKTGVVPFEIWSGGKGFWQNLADNESTAITFDAAMIQVRLAAMLF